MATDGSLSSSVAFLWLGMLYAGRPLAVCLDGHLNPPDASGVCPVCGVAAFVMTKQNRAALESILVLGDMGRSRDFAKLIAHERSVIPIKRPK